MSKFAKDQYAGLGFNGQDNGSSQRGYNSKYQHNQHTGHMNDGRLVNYGRGPTKVGGGSTKVDGKQPPKEAHGKAQKRNPGGTREVPKCSYEINVGRGPTKGNQQ